MQVVIGAQEQALQIIQKKKQKATIPKRMDTLPMRDCERTVAFLQYARRSLQTAIDKQNLYPSHKQHFTRIAKQIGSLIDWLTRRGELDLFNIETDLKGNAEALLFHRLASLVSELSSWRYYENDLMSDLGEYAEMIRHIYDRSLNGFGISRGLRYTLEFKNILHPGTSYLSTPPLSKIEEWVSHSQAKKVFRIDNNQAIALQVEGVIYNPKVASYFYNRNEVESLSFNNIFQRWGRLLEEQDISYLRSAILELAGSREIEQAIHTALPDYFLSGSSGPYGISKKGLQGSLMKCLHHTEPELWVHTIRNIFPQIIKSLVPIFKEHTHLAVLLLADLKKVGMSVQIPKMRDEHWHIILKETGEFCEAIIPAKKRTVEEALTWLGFRKERGAGTEGAAFLMSIREDGRRWVHLKAQASIPSELTVSINERIVEDHLAFKLCDGTRNIIEDALVVSKASGVSLQEFADSMFYRLSYHPQE